MDDIILLKKIRKERKLTQYALANISGISQNYISEIENGKHYATEKIILILCKSLDVDPNTLLGWN